MRKLILLACLVPAAWAQTALFTGVPEQQVKGGWQLGTVAANDAPLETHFRIRNLGSAPAAVTFLKVAGTAFTLADPPVLPESLAPGAALDFQVNFAPLAPGYYSASLESDGIAVFLLVTAVAAPNVWVSENGAWRALTGGAGVAFGEVQRGATATRTLVVENCSPEPLDSSAVVVTSDAFRLAGSWPALEPGGRRTFEVVFAPQAASPAEGMLRIGLRHVPLAGTGIEAALPAPRILLDLASPASGRQGSLTVALDEVSHTAAEGEVRLDFEPAVPGAHDPAILFASGGRVAHFTIAEGDQEARFGERTAVGFQTGSTAGTLVFTLQVASFTRQERVAIPAAPIEITATGVARAASSVEVRVAGFDNARSAAQLSFTFYDQSGTAIPPGAVTVDGRGAFQGYFASSDAAGAFLLRAVFPVNGDPALVAAVEVQLGNSQGLAGTGRLRF